MKKLIVIALTMLGLGMNAQSPFLPSAIIRSWVWNGYEHILFEIEGHRYLEVRYKGGHPTMTSAVTIIHLESCPCKNGGR